MIIHGGMTCGEIVVHSQDVVPKGILTISVNTITIVT